MFKRFVSCLLALCLACGMFSVVLAENGEISVFLDGEKLNFDVPPQMINDRTMVPMRKIFEAMGAVVVWDDSTETVTATKNAKEVNLTVGSNTVYKNGSPIHTDVPAQLIDGRTLVPIRVVSEALECNVDWIEETNTVNITSNIKSLGCGNTSGNLANGGQVAYSNGTVYYYDSVKNGLYKMNADASSQEFISADYCQSLNIVEDWIYYIAKEKIVKIKPDGTNRTVLNCTDRALECMVIANGYLYYLDIWGGLFKADLDGSNAQRIGDFRTNYFQIEGDWIYYVSERALATGLSIYRVKTDGTEQREIANDVDSFVDFSVVNGWIYYVNHVLSSDIPYHIQKVSIDGTNKKLLHSSQNRICKLNVANDSIYYSTSYGTKDTDELRRININGENDTLCKAFNESIFSIGTYLNYIVCSTYVQHNGEFFNSIFVLSSDTNGAYNSIYESSDSNDDKNGEELKNPAPDQIKLDFVNSIKHAFESENKAIKDMDKLSDDRVGIYTISFYGNVKNAITYFNAAYQTSLEYSDLSSTSSDLKNILRVLEDIETGEYSLVELYSRFSSTLKYERSLVDKLERLAN